MRKQPFIPLCAVILLCCVLGPLPAYSEGGDPLSEARANIERAHQELEGAFSAKKRGDLDAAKRYQQETMRLLREARALYLEFLDSHPGDVAVTLEYADLLAQTGDFDLAAECLERAIARAPRHAPLWLALGRDLAQVGPQRSTDALRALQRAVSCAVEDEVRADALAELGVQYWKQGLYDFSRDAFDQAHAINPDHLTARIGLIGHDIRAGRIAQASDSLDALGVLEPVKGALLDEFLQQGLDLFVQARRWFPDTVDNHLAYAKTLARANRFAQAIPPLERALALRPDDFVSWNLLGSACRVLDDTERARQAFSRSLEINPDQPRTRDALAELAQSSAALPPEGRSQSQ